ncbi:hypothetical protein [Rhizobium rhizogenes]|uniref:hypothetical protein n=1 Tax=Rhizobium rhizogenes TaxID=359 RepID=UPI0022C82C75|nr:hypothetical protein [Rhizobium rhizogenes]MCZ7479601.1 hypothetical protein [Rhizobium rhizogenes]
MLSHYNNLESLIAPADCKQSVELDYGSIELYTGKSADRLSAAGLLNLVLREPTGCLLVCTLASIKNTNLTIKYQEAVKEPNTSAVIDIWLEGPELRAQHWDGFTSRFDMKNMKLLSQEFTK